MKLNHFDDQGHAHMVDVGNKQPSDRQARAEARVCLGGDLLQRILDREITKGDVLGVARLAGIQAVKRTADLIPLAHPLAVCHCAVDFRPEPTAGALIVTCAVRAHDRTGVEMEAITGATVAALTVYDMCKGQDKSITVEKVRLLFKSGGKSGVFRAEVEADHE